MAWIALAGIVLQVVGLGLAVQGVAETYREALRPSDPDAEAPDLWARLRCDLGQWFRRVILRRPQDRPVYLGVANMTLPHLVQSGVLRTRPPKPADDAPTDDKVAYLLLYVDALDGAVAAAHEHAATLVKDAESRLGRRIDEVSARIDQTNENMTALHAAFVGIDGAGLRRAAVGLCVTIFGVMLTTAGLPW